MFVNIQLTRLFVFSLRKGLNTPHTASKNGGALYIWAPLFLEGKEFWNNIWRILRKEFWNNIWRILHECSCFTKQIFKLSLRKRNKMLGKPRILSLFPKSFNKFNNTRARMLDFIYHMTNTLKSHFWHKNVILLSFWSQRCYGRHNVSRKSINH